MNTHEVISLDHPSPSNIGPKLMLTVVEAAELLGIKRTLMYTLLGSGAVPSVQIGRLRRIRRTDLEIYAAQLIPTEWTEGEDIDAPQETPARHESTQRSRQCLSGQRRTMARQGHHGRARQRHT